nr:MAG TPA: hypothetical protein [Caudoviricetes sp.]
MLQEHEVLQSVTADSYIDNNVIKSAFYLRVSNIRPIFVVNK